MTPGARAPFAGHEVEVRRLEVAGHPVWGAADVVRDGEVIHGPAIAPTEDWPRFDLGEDGALAAVSAALPGHRTSPRATREWVLLGDALVPALRVQVLLPGPAVWAVHVHAVDGTILRSDLVSRAARGRVYEGSPLTSGVVTVELPGVDGPTLDGPWVRARSCDAWAIGGSLFSSTSCEALARHATADAAGDFLFPATPAAFGDPFAEVHLYWHADHFVRWLDARYGLRLPYGPIWANANFPMSNAFFGDFDLDGVPEVSFGTDTRTGTDFAYDADVVYHELGHAVVGEWAPGLPFLSGDAVGMDWTGGSLNEGLADIFSMVHATDPYLAEYAGSAYGERAIRDLERPRRCPDDLLGEVHADGEIVASFGWQLVADPDVGPDVVSELLAGAVPGLGGDVTWERVGAAFHRAADDLWAAGGVSDAGHDAFLAHLAASNLEGCGRVVPLDDGRVVPQLLVNGGLLGPLERMPGGVGFSVEVPADATAVLVDVEEFQAADGMGFAVYGRWDEPVGHEATVVDALGLGFATPAEFDFVVDGVGSELHLEVGGEGPELQPGRTLFLSLASVNQGSLAPFDFQYGSLTLRAHVERPTPRPAPDPAGCATAPGGLAAALTALLLLRRRASTGR
jgi:hypothetical protein